MLSLLFNPSGRVNRRTWWLATVSAYGSWVLAYSWGGLVSSRDYDGIQEPLTWPEPLVWLAVLASLALIAGASWCWIALSVKRLHDRDHSAWWMLWFAVPIIGSWVILITL